MVRSLDNIYKNKFFIKAATNMIKGLMDYEEHKKIEVLTELKILFLFSLYFLGFQQSATTRQKRKINRG
jgi:hypothetical protein